MVKIKSLIIFAALQGCLSICLFGCKPATSRDVCGSYFADYGQASEKLILNNDGTYSQEVKVKTNKKPDKVKGTWDYDPKSGYVTFNENFLMVLDEFQQVNPQYARPEKGLVGLPVENWFGHISIGVSKGVIYEKK